MVNVNMLRGKIIEKGFTTDDLAKAINVTRSTFYRKIAQKGMTFTIREATDIVKSLHLSNEEAIAIFFN